MKGWREHVLGHIISFQGLFYLTVSVFIQRLMLFSGVYVTEEYLPFTMEESPAVYNNEPTPPETSSLKTDGDRPPPSPLSGGYLLIVIGEPQIETHKPIILQKLAKGK